MTDSANTAVAVDVDELNKINYKKHDPRDKGSDLVDFFSNKILPTVPEDIEMITLHKAHKLIYSKIKNRVRIHRVKANGLAVGVLEVKGDERKELRLTGPETFKVPAPVSKKPADRTIFDDDGNVLRQIPIGETNSDYIWQLEVLANEFLDMDPKMNLGVHFRPAISRGKVKSLMMTVYTVGREKIKTASPKKVKINMMQTQKSDETLNTWLEKVQGIYDDCAARILNIPVEYEGMKFDRREFLEGRLVIVSVQKTDLNEDLLDRLRRLVK